MRPGFGFLVQPAYEMAKVLIKLHGIMLAWFADGGEDIALCP